MDFFLQLVANGLVTGSFYALSALGLTLILGLMRVVNFAHGEFYMLGGVLGWWVTTQLGIGFLPGLLLVALLMGGFGWLVDRVLIERIRNQGEEPGILLTIGLSIVLSNAALLAFGTAPLKIEGPVANAPLFVGPVVLTKLRLLAMVACALLIFAVHRMIRHTAMGRAMRATFQDAMAARLVGISTANVHAATFALGTVIAALAGMLLGSIYSTQVGIGGLVSMKAFVVVILGGMGSFAGAILGGLILGLVEALWGGYVATGWVDIVGFVIVILTLLLRPYGLFSQRTERA